MKSNVAIKKYLMKKIMAFKHGQQNDLAYSTIMLLIFSWKKLFGGGNSFEVNSKKC